LLLPKHSADGVCLTIALCSTRNQVFAWQAEGLLVEMIMIHGRGA
jgi:hypothetical protein